MHRLLRSALAFSAVLAAASPLRSQEQIQVEELPATPADNTVSPSESADLAALETQAVQLYSDGELKRALDLYLDLAERHSEIKERARLRITAAWLSWQLEDRAGALARLESALYEKPDAPFRAELYAPEFAALYQDALRTAVHRRRVTASEGINRAVDEIRGQRYEEARRLLLDALSMVPDDPDGVYNLALVDLRQGRTEAALAGFERVLALERGNPEGVTRGLKNQALNNAAVIYYSRGDFTDAETALAEAVAQKPDDASAWFNLGLTRQKLGHAEEAYDALRRARLLDASDVAIARALAVAEVERRNWVAAVALLVEATQARPADAELRLQLGRAQRGLGNVAGAIDSFRKALALDPPGKLTSTGNAALLLAETLQVQGDAAGAEDAANRAVQLRPDDASSWMFLGLARLIGSNADGARQALERASELAPRRADVLHNLGSAYLSLHDEAHAEEVFRAALAIDPDDAETRAAIAALEARRAVPPTGRAARSALARLGAKLAVGDYAALGIRGLRVESVSTGSAAARAGLRVGDLLLRAEGKPLESLDAFEKIFSGKHSTGTLALLREGKPLELRLSLD
jgi:tetratricopeptide (TPR) repeat protein